MSRVTRDHYKTDEEFYEALVSKELEWVKQQREEVPYGYDIKPRITIVGPQFQTARIPMVWNSSDEKYEMMARVAYIARVTSAKAVMVTSDTRWVSSDDFSQHFGLPKGLSFEMYQKEYVRILKQYGGEMANLPRHLWSEAVLATLKIAPESVQGNPHRFFRTAPYTKGAGNRVMWLPPEPQLRDGGGGQMKIDMIGDWWEIPDDDPDLIRATELAGTLLREILEKVAR